MHEHYDQSLFCSGVKKHCLWWGEGLESALVVRLLGPGAGLGLWAALGCWRSDGAVFATFQQLEIGTMYSVHGLSGANIVIFE